MVWTLPAGYKDWRLLSVHHRSDNGTLRAVLGNDVAIKAAREGKTNPWPEGAVLAKMVWKGNAHDRFPTATEPAAFVHAEFMVKDSKRFTETGGWGYGPLAGRGSAALRQGRDICAGMRGVPHAGEGSRTGWFTHPVKLP